MRKLRLSILVFALVALSAAPSFAGDMSLGLKMGLLTSNVTGTPESWDDNMSYRTAFAAGAVMNYAIDESWSVEPELMYFSKGFTSSIYDYEDFVSVDAEASFDYMELVGLLKYSFLPGAKFRPCVFAGPSFAYSLSSDLKLSLGPFSATADIGSLTHSTDFGVVAGAGFGYEVGDGVGVLTFDARFQRGFTNVIMTGDFEVNGDTQTISVDDFKNYGFAFLVGFRLYL